MSPRIQSGGTLAIAAIGDFPAGLDPAREYYTSSWELFRCCLLRTLLSYNGRRTEEGGAVARPDIAAEMPDISSNGLTWTFHLKRGLHYAPPLQHVEIKAEDVVRALEREADPRVAQDFQPAGGYPDYYSVIAGFDDYRAGKARSISGLKTPDDHTLVVTLTHPEGDLLNLFAMPATAPVPPNPFVPDARYGVADPRLPGGYGSHLVASGPYMIEGSTGLDFSLAPYRQPPVSGYVPSHSLTLVRNPSWDPATDDLRAALADRIDVRIEGPLGLYRGQEKDLRQVASDRLDFVFYATMNIAAPPFDDVNVRRAVNYVIDKNALVRQFERHPELEFAQFFGPSDAEAATHVGLDSEEDDLLLAYDPYGTSAHGGGLAKARNAMRDSRYDHDRDGVCDASVCKGVLTLAAECNIPADSVETIRKDVAEIGIALRVRMTGCSDPFYTELGTPSEKIPLGLGAAWGKDFPNASNFLATLFSGGSHLHDSGNFNYSLVGATSEQLKRWGYRTHHVKTVDGRIDQCTPLVGRDQAECWADLDKYLMQEVVPWAPYLKLNTVRLVSSRVDRFSWDQATSEPALDRIGLSSSAPPPSPIHSVSRDKDVVAAIPVGFVPQGIAAEDGSVWVAADGYLWRIDPATSRVRSVVRVGVDPVGVVAGPEGMWVANQADATVSRVHPATNSVTATVPVGAGPGYLAEGAGALWVANSGDGTVSRVDPETGKIVATVRVGANPGGIAFGQGAVWVANSGDGTVSRIDTETNQVVATIDVGPGPDVGSGPSDLAVGQGSVWASTFQGESVSRIDPQTNEVADKTEMGGLSLAVLVADHAVWATTADNVLARIDPGSGRITARYVTGWLPSFLAVDHGSLWVSAQYSHEVERVDPSA